MTNLPAAFLSVVLIGGCSSVPDYTAKVDENDLPENNIIIRVDARQSVSPEKMMRVLLEEAARSAIDRGGVYFRVDRVAIGPTTSSVVHPPPASRVAPNRTTVSASSTEAAIEATIMALGSFTIQKQRSGSLTMTIGRDPLEGEHVFEAAKLLDQLREGGAGMEAPKSDVK